MADLSFQVEGEAQSAARLNAKTRQFSIIIDEPPALGGEDLGANPVEYLLASYAGCINVVAHLTAGELGIKLTSLKIDVEGDLNPGRLFGQSESERAGFKQIRVKFLPETNASPELIDRWLQVIQNRCPINDNLKNPTPLTFNIVQPAISD